MHRNVLSYIAAPLFKTYASKTDISKSFIPRILLISLPVASATLYPFFLNSSIALIEEAGIFFSTQSISVPSTSKKTAFISTS